MNLDHAYAERDRRELLKVTRELDEARAEVERLKADLGQGINDAYHQGRTDERRAWAAHLAPIGEPDDEPESPDLLIPLRQFLDDLPPGIVVTITRPV